MNAMVTLAHIEEAGHGADNAAVFQPEARSLESPIQFADVSPHSTVVADYHYTEEP